MLSRWKLILALCVATPLSRAFGQDLNTTTTTILTSPSPSKQVAMGIKTQEMLVKSSSDEAATPTKTTTEASMTRLGRLTKRCKSCTTSVHPPRTTQQPIVARPLTQSQSGSAWVYSSYYDPYWPDPWINATTTVGYGPSAVISTPAPSMVKWDDHQSYVCRDYMERHNIKRSCQTAMANFEQNVTYKAYTSRYARMTGFLRVVTFGNAGCTVQFSCEDYGIGMTGEEIRIGFSRGVGDGMIETCGNVYLSNSCPSEAKIIFRNQTSTDLVKKRAANTRILSGRELGSWSGQTSDTWKQPVSPPTTDRATTFFMRHYVFDRISSGSSVAIQDNHEYLPNLIRNQKSALGPLSTMVAAVGFAALSNAGNVPEWRAQALELYGSALIQLQAALRHPVRRISDETLGTVLLMGTFENIVSTDVSSMKAFSQHVSAAAKCIEMRGPDQFHSVVGLKLFMQMRRIMITTCHQLQEPVPFELAKWSRWAECSQSNDLVPVNRFSEINEALASVRAKLKYQGITDPAVISAQLLEIDRRFVDWAHTLPLSWEYKSYRSIGPKGIPSTRYDSQYDTYSDPWIACVWNCYRNVRLLIHESIIVATLKHGTNQQKDGLQSSAKVLTAMADGICHSVAYHLGYQPRDGTAESSTKIEFPDRNPSPGGFLLLWPLFFSGIQRTTPPDQRQWVAATIRRIGLQMGLQLAMSMAELLDNTQKEISFSDDDTFLLGEWHPN
ncbi:hypothetical protein F66182_8465 [Fusarium sp. NRRL 66182]|nr:hypothetical protein F66182_8465 [Fusarium sp. NRRL 66182]